MKDDKIMVHKAGTDVFVGTDKDKIEAKITGAVIRSYGIQYEIVYWKEKTRITEYVDESEVYIERGKKEKIPIGFVKQE